MSTSSEYSLLTDLQKQLKNGQARGDSLANVLMTTLAYFESARAIPNLSKLVPYLFHYNGQPIDLIDYPVMEPLYNVRRPSRILLLCSRQVGKSINEVTTTLLESLWTPHLNTLFVAPQYEMIRRISTDYFAGIINESPAAGLFHGKNTVSQVLERSFPNGSRIRFTYAHRTADRARGIHARSLKRDEVQMMDESVLPVLLATMSSSPWGNYLQDAGTPLTRSNAASQAFMESSRSHWMIPCRSCGKENIAAPGYDLTNMIGSTQVTIDRDHPAIRCANTKCGYYLYPWDGRYIHLSPDKRDSFLGLHVPQMILPLHCCDRKKWLDFMKVIEDPMIADYVKYNEYFGIPWDDGVALVTLEDLLRVSDLAENYLHNALRAIQQSHGQVAIGIDWGGGGVNRISRTKLAITVLNPNTGRTHVVFGMDILRPMDESFEALQVWHVIEQVLKVCPTAIICHDDSTFGSAKMTLLRQLGLSENRIMNMTYVGETKNQTMVFNPPTADRLKPLWSVDKSRSLKFLCHAIRTGQVHFFAPTVGLNAISLLSDFTHLVAEEYMRGTSGAEVLMIQRMEGQSDDFAHAVNFSCLGLWQTHKAWPKIKPSEMVIVTPQDLASYVQALRASLDSATIESLIARPSEATAT